MVSTPSPPDPYKTANAQAAANVGAANAAAIANNPNETNPWGSINNTIAGSERVIIGQDKKGNPVYGDVNRYNREINLSPEGQKLFDQQNKLGSSLNELAIDQTDRLTGHLSDPIDFSGLPDRVTSVSAPEFDGALSLERPDSPTFTDPGLKKEVDSSAFDRAGMEDAMFDRIKEESDRDWGTTEATLAARGIMPGTEMYRRAMEAHTDNTNRARLDAMKYAGDELSRSANLELTKFGAENAARLSDAGLSDSRGLMGLNFSNARNSAALAENAATNAATQQQFNAGMMSGEFANNARNQALQEMLAGRNQPINEISALMRGGQVTAPQFQQFRGQGIEPAPISENVWNAYNAQMQQASAQNGLFGSVLGGIGGLFGLSDERAKENIRMVGETFDGLPVYVFNYIGDEETRMGVMAQEVEDAKPEAVVEVNGVKYVDYSQVS